VESPTNAPKRHDYIDVNGLRTYHEVHGDGEPLLLLHGGFCPAETMAGLTAQLAAHFQVYFPERRATGRTPDAPGPITYELMAEDTIAFLAAVNVPSAHVVGWSDGAVVGLLVALRRPDLVRHLVLIGQYINQDGMPPGMREMLAQEQMPDMLPPMFRELYAAVSPDGPAHWDVVTDKMWQLYRTEPQMSLSALAAVRAPTLILIGEHDLVTMEHAEAMRDALPDGRLEVVPGADHGMPMRQPEEVSRVVLPFLGAHITE
jgi:pimeloyl-ACP methyl ester carboxylesterase